MRKVFARRKTRQLNVGGVLIGGDAPVAVQSMTNTHTDDAAATLAQIQRLADAGCDIIRCAVPDMAAAEGLKTICKESPIPVIADIHFDYKLALAAIEAGVHGLRLNPGNIGGEDRVRAVVEAARERNLPIRIGVNAGSLPKDLLEKYGHPTAEALVEAAWRHIHILEDMDYRNIKVSLKAHDVPLTLAAYRLLASQCDYPLHVGITEAGTVNSGIIKSAVGIGTLLAEGIHAVSLKLGNQILVYQTAIHHGNHFQHVCIGDATAVYHLTLDAEGCGYLGGTAATAMYQYFLAGNGCKILQELCQLLAVFNDGTAYLYYCYFFHFILC